MDTHTLPNGQTVKLGRPSPSPHNPKDLHLRAILRAPSQLPPPPEVIDNTQSVLNLYGPNPWPMLGNDRYGCCVFASSGHRRITQSAMNGQKISVSTDDVLRAYAAVTGFDPQTGANDNGTMMVDAANWERANNLAGDKIYAFARVAIDPRDTEMVSLATYYFGGVWMGVGLPNSAKAQTGHVWDVDNSSDGEPNSWGGHAIWVPKRKPDVSECITWATQQAMTQAFIDKYADEGWVVLPVAWQGQDPFGAIDWNALNACVANFGPVDPSS